MIVIFDERSTVVFLQDSAPISGYIKCSKMIAQVKETE